jgi:hypothetical protein
VDKSGQGTDASKAIVDKAQSVGESDEQKAKSGWQRASKPGQAGDAKGAALGSARTETNELMKQLDTVAAAAAEAAVPIVRSAMEYWEEKEQRDQAPASGSKEVGKALSIMGGYWRDPRIQAPRAASKYAGKHKAEQARGSAKFQEARASFRKQFGKRKTLDERQKEWKAKQNAPEPDAKTGEIGQALLKLLQQAGGGAGDKAEVNQEELASLKERMLEGQFLIDAEYKKLAENLTPEECKELYDKLAQSNLALFARFYDHIPDERKHEINKVLDFDEDQQIALAEASSDEGLINAKLAQFSPPRKIHPITGDGDCLYQSIIETTGIGSSIKDLRDNVADTMEANAGRLRLAGFRYKNETDLEQQLDRDVRRGGRWDSNLGDMTAEVLAAILGEPITVVTAGGDTRTLAPGAWRLPDKLTAIRPKKTPVVLGYVGNNHYHATKETEPAPKLKQD